VTLHISAFSYSFRSDREVAINKRIDRAQAAYDNMTPPEDTPEPSEPPEPPDEPRGGEENEFDN